MAASGAVRRTRTSITTSLTVLSRTVLSFSTLVLRPASSRHALCRIQLPPTPCKLLPETDHGVEEMRKDTAASARGANVAPASPGQQTFNKGLCKKLHHHPGTMRVYVFRRRK